MATKKSQQSGSSSSSKNTMDELLAQYGGGVKGLSSGDKVKGRVVSISSKRVVLDIGGKVRVLLQRRLIKKQKITLEILMWVMK